MCTCQRIDWDFLDMTFNHAMSYDQRIIVGREAALGLVGMKEVLEDPARLLFDI
jgi:pyruvate/2-oxoglutarate dehydrogenase complex dihydrolipoamide acyltransferase (E2) component